MAKRKRKKEKSPIRRWRRVSQFFFLITLNPYFEAFFYRGVTCPAMNCWACPAAAFACPVGVVGNAIHFGLIPFVAIGSLLFVGAVAGRIACGWVCPFGLLQDLMHKIPSRKLGLPKALAYGKYVFLVGTVILVPLFLGVRESPGSDAFFCSYCPAGTLEAAIPRRVFPGAAGENILESGPALPDDADAEPPPEEDPGGDDLFGEDGEELFGDEGTGNPDLFGGAGGRDADGDWIAKAAKPESEIITSESVFTFLLVSPRAWILYGFLALFIFSRRPFCRMVCPIGAVFALLNRFSFFRLRVEKDACKDCSLCSRTCPVDKQARDGPNSEACVRCFECLDTCSLRATKAGVIAAASKEETYWE